MSAADVDRGFWTRQAEHLAASFIDRAEQIRALQVAVLTREHAFLLGPPGTGKSSFVRAFMAGFEGRYFEQSLSRTRADAAVLGPVSIPQLRDTGRFQRETRGFLLDSEWAFLDEIAHISPELGHDLHAALNERIHHEVADGRSARTIPLRTAVTSANCLPQLNDAADGDDSRALWDRLLVRVPMDYLSSRDDARQLLQLTDDPLTTNTPETALPEMGRPRLSLAALDGQHDAVRALPIASDLIETCLDLRERLAETGDVFSDRRWRASMRVLRASAWLRGDDRVEVEDLQTLTLTLWDSTDQRTRVHRQVVLLTDPVESERLELLDTAALLLRTSRDYGDRSAPVREAWRKEAERKLRHLRERADALGGRWAGRDQNDLRVLRETLDAARRDVAALRQSAHLAG